jgi:hypothetical protein
MFSVDLIQHFLDALAIIEDLLRYVYICVFVYVVLIGK